MSESEQSLDHNDDDELESNFEWESSIKNESNFNAKTPPMNHTELQKEYMKIPSLKFLSSLAWINKIENRILFHGIVDKNFMKHKIWNNSFERLEYMKFFNIPIEKEFTEDESIVNNFKNDIISNNWPFMKLKEAIRKMKYPPNENENNSYNSIQINYIYLFIKELNIKLPNIPWYMKYSILNNHFLPKEITKIIDFTLNNTYLCTSCMQMKTTSIDERCYECRIENLKKEKMKNLIKMTNKLHKKKIKKNYI